MTDFQNIPQNNDNQINNTLDSNKVVADASINNEQVEQATKKSYPKVIILIPLILFIALAYILLNNWQTIQKLLFDKEENVEIDNISPTQEVFTAEEFNDENETQITSELMVDDNCDQFPDQLVACNPYKCEFIHPLTQEPMIREIVGIVENNCHYLEQMPNSGQMKCQYDEATRLAIAQYYKDLDQAKNISIEISGGLSPEGVDVETKEVVDGQEILENPLQEALDSGMCEISGY